METPKFTGRNVPITEIAKATVTANQTSGQKMSRDQPRPKSRIRFITMNCSELL